MSVGQVQLLSMHTAQAHGTSWRYCSIGGFGTEVAANLEDGGGQIAVYAVTAQQADGPIFLDAVPEPARAYGSVASSRFGRGHVNLSFVGNSSTSLWVPCIRYADTSEGHRWSKTFPAVASMGNSLPSRVHVSDYGGRVVAWWFNASTGQTTLIVLDEMGNVVAEATIAKPISSVLNSTGSRLFFTTTLGLVAFDTVTGVVHSPINGFAAPTSALAANREGTIIAFGNADGSVDVFRASSALALPTYWRSVPTAPGCIVTVLTISGDGSTMALGYSNRNDSRQQAVKIVAFSDQTFAVRHEHAFQGAGNYSLFLTDMVSSHSGDVIVLGTSGDQLRTMPELFVYQRDVSDYVHTSQSLPGTVYALAISQNGATLAATCASNHISTSPQSALLAVYDIGSELRCFGVPRAGSTVTFEIDAAEGAQAVLGTGDLSEPVMFPAATGFLFLGHASVVGRATGDVNGRAHLSYTVPSEIGSTFFFQGFRYPARTLTRNWIAFTVIP